MGHVRLGVLPAYAREWRQNAQAHVAHARLLLGRGWCSFGGGARATCCGLMLT